MPRDISFVEFVRHSLSFELGETKGGKARGKNERVKKFASTSRVGCRELPFPFPRTFHRSGATVLRKHLHYEVDSFNTHISESQCTRHMYTCSVNWLNLIAELINLWRAQKYRRKTEAPNGEKTGNVEKSPNQRHQHCLTDQ